MSKSPRLLATRQPLLARLGVSTVDGLDPSSIFGGVKRLSMLSVGDRSRRVRWGILSTARINELVLAAAGASPLLEFVAVASRDLDRAAAYAQAHGLDRAYGSYEELLADPDIEAVYISLPNALHVEWSVRGLEAGKHVLCEKPFSNKPADVAAAFRSADAAGRLLSEGFMFRHHPQTRRLSDLVTGGAVGRTMMINATMTLSMQDLEGDFRSRATMDGGALMDLGAYCVNVSRLLAGEPVRVYGEHVKDGHGVDVQFAATLRFPNDVLAHFDVGFNLQTRYSLEVAGRSGSLIVNDPWHNRAPRITIKRDFSTDQLTPPSADAYRLQLEDFSGAVRHGRATALGRDDALGQARVLEALLKSAEEQQPVELTGLDEPHRIRPSVGG